ncbi:hypothetical protein Q8A73_014702 [Channa argus]|nr:hypothetical protein Q8A73_014702 [Channa argus]
MGARKRERQREDRKAAGERAAMCRGIGEALGRNLNRRRLLRRQEMRGRLVPGMGLDVSDPDRYQKEETYVVLLGITWDDGEHVSSADLCFSAESVGVTGSALMSRSR